MCSTIDLSKAFDSVDQVVGFSEMALHWVNNYLSERTQCVSADNFISSQLKLTKGVPQGSI